MCAQYMITQIYKEILGGFQESYKKQDNYSRGFYTPLSTLDRSSKQNINKNIAALNNALDQMDLTDIYRNFHPKAANTHYFQMYMEHFQR